MPEAVANPPQTYRALTNPNVGPVFADATQQLATMHPPPERGVSAFEVRRKEASRIRKVIERRFPDYHPGRLETMLDFVFGFVRLEEESITAQRIENMYQRELSARIQHNLTHQIIYGGAPLASSSYVDTTYAVFTGMEQQVDVLKRLQTTSMEMYWAGVRNEIAVVKTLLGNGYTVFVPDYAQDTGELDDQDNEVLQLDVKRGIDLITVSPEGKIILLDVKGRRIPDVMLEKTARVALTDQTHPCVRRAIEKAGSSRALYPPRIIHATLIFPTEGRSFKPSKMHDSNIKTSGDKREALASFAVLQPHVEVSIIEQLQQLQKESAYNQLPVTSLR